MYTEEMIKDYKKQLYSWEKRKEEMSMLYDKGESISEIARMFGVSRQRAHQILFPNKIQKTASSVATLSRWWRRNNK